ncbi:C45 family peptidase [Reichenbachiella agarivorans]|uniref:C45 family peptidase n=1 Tax=Reichenbachiella agarivorans TaxID=2979464 RepID=A0ABY6CK34_9BACT|nr:C45 family peptidase [Reichenbachiella agarivorans]UXP30754.1 C45 family peptidase [Reichenbachiella agarivorans]
MKKRYLVAAILLILILAGSWYFVSRVIYDAPDTPVSTINSDQLVVISDSHFRLGNSWLKRNKYGNWESYIEGSAYDRGRTIGILHRQLIQDQEEVFVDEINAHVPSWFLRKFLMLGISWFNRDLDQYIPDEYRQEIYGVSEFFADEYDFIGPKYNRIINYHAAHDIGHAVQNMHLVGCTSLGVWNFDDSTKQMLSGRNFDFYFGDEFAKNKIVLLCNPTEGYKYLSVTWGGFCGVVSGMNEHGLSITLNSAKSEIPTESGTPVSIIARDILQYASTLEEAQSIANQYESFVSELFTISSLKDQKMAVIEKAPTYTGIYYPSSDTLIVTNHYQSPELKDLPINTEHMNSSESVDRMTRTRELTNRLQEVTPNTIVDILRNQAGIAGKDLGMGNPKAINQLLAHHAVIFDNVEKCVWVSNYPFQENVFDAYDLDDFGKWSDLKDTVVTIDSLSIEADPFYTSEAFQQFKQFKVLKSQITYYTQERSKMDSLEVRQFIQSNPEYYETHRLVGNYYAALGEKQKAIDSYYLALEKDIAYLEDRQFINKQIKELSE